MNQSFHTVVVAVSMLAPASMSCMASGADQHRFAVHADSHALIGPPPNQSCEGDFVLIGNNRYQSACSLAHASAVSAASALAVVEPGYLTVRSRATSGVGAPSESGAEAKYLDSITIHADSYEGISGEIHAKWLITLNATGTNMGPPNVGSAHAQCDLFLGSGSKPVEAWFASWNSTFGPGGVALNSYFVEVVRPVTIGTAIVIGCEGSAFTAAGGNRTVLANVGGGTGGLRGEAPVMGAVWAGMTIEGIEGLTEFTVESASGFDYSRPYVPPPQCVGDADHDGGRDFSDITSVLKHWGATYLPGEVGAGDANNDDEVDFSDITDVLTSFAIACP